MTGDSGFKRAGLSWKSANTCLWLLLHQLEQSLNVLSRWTVAWLWLISKSGFTVVTLSELINHYCGCTHLTFAFYFANFDRCSSGTHPFFYSEVKVRVLHISLQSYLSLKYNFFNQNCKNHWRLIRKNKNSTKWFYHKSRSAKGHGKFYFTIA